MCFDEKSEVGEREDGGDRKYVCLWMELQVLLEDPANFYIMRHQLPYQTLHTSLSYL